VIKEADTFLNIYRFLDYGSSKDFMFLFEWQREGRVWTLARPVVELSGSVMVECAAP
jgi:hypothetical protein